MIRKTISALALTAAIASYGFAADEGKHEGDDKKLTIDTVPAAVKEGINSHLDGGTIKSIQEKKKEGKTAYKVQIEKDGKTVNKYFDDKGAEIVKEHGDHGHDHDHGKGAK